MSESLNKALKAAEKETGLKIRLVNDDSVTGKIDVIPTGSIMLDYVLGCGGYPRGRVIEIFGPESGGKSTIALLAIAQAQKMGLNALYVDAEHSFSKEFAEQLGVDNSKLYYVEPDYAEAMFEGLKIALQQNAFGIIVIDSVTALVPKEEFEASIEKQQMGLQARMLGKAIKNLVSTVSKSNACLIFINQVRDKIGVMFGDPETTPGGRALKFYSSVRLRVNIKKRSQIHDEENEKRIIGHRASVIVKKNKVGPPHGTCEYDLIYGHGVDNAGELFDLGVDMGLIEKEGRTYSIQVGELKEKLASGRDKAKNVLKESEEYTNMIRKAANID